MNNIVYIGSVGWADTASAIHIQNRAKLMKTLGFHTWAISDWPTDGKIIDDNSMLSYIYLPMFKGPKKMRGFFWNLDQWICMFSYTNIIKHLKSICPNVVVLYEVNSIMLEIALRNYCKRKKIKFMIETTEWMEWRKYSDLKTRLIVLQKDFQKRYIDRKCGNIIAISHYLEEHYTKQNCNVLRLPPLFSGFENDIIITRYKDERCDAKVNLVFAGTLSRKDFLEPLLKAIVRINQNVIAISFDIVGPNENEIMQIMGQKNLIQYGVFCHGTLPHDETLFYVKRADFSVLLRENMRYAKAGVSTKFVEAMCMGVPSICTTVGGTDRFVEHIKNGVLVDENTEKELYNTLCSILKMNSDEILNMKRNAHLFAKEHFSVDVYKEQMADFLEKSV